MGNLKNKRIVIFLLFLAAFILRAALTTLINKGDILAIEEWSRVLYKEGLAGSYFREGWVYTFPTQPPLMMLCYWFSRWLYEQKYFLSIWHNFCRLPPTFIILWLDKNGPFFLVKLWGILADLLSAVLVYQVIKKVTKKPVLAFWSMIFVLFNPLLIFESSIWGQVDMLAALFGLTCFLVFFLKKIGRVASPVIFCLGAMLKPSILILGPIYIFFLLKQLIRNPSERNKILKEVFLGLLLSLVLIILTFVPFLGPFESPSGQLNAIVTRRILPSAKGVSKVATSAYNFFTLFFKIDKTLGSQKIAFLTLDQLGDSLFLLINFLGGVFLFSLTRKKDLLPKQVEVLSFIGYFVAQGAFLFKTGMAERYFFPAFLFVCLLFFLVDDLKVKTGIFLQMVAWFFNLTTSFYLGGSEFLDHTLRQNNFLGTRIASLFSLLVFFFISLNYLKDKKFSFFFKNALK